METGILVGDVMAKGIITANPGDTVKKACEIMAKHDLSGITVMEKKNVVGVLTQGDLVSMIAKGKESSKTRVKDIMSIEMVSIGPEADISQAARLMVDNKVKRLPVLKNERLIGVITQTDIVRVSPSVYDLIFEKARLESGPILEDEIALSGECEECGNFGEELRNVNGTLVCKECHEEIEGRV
jgi:CBS domain-containing protein